MNGSFPTDSVVTPAGSPLAIGNIHNFKGIHFDPMVPVNAPAVPAAPPAAPAVPPSPGTGSAAVPPAASLEDNVGFKNLREQYEQTKREADQWKSLGNYDDVAQAHKTYGETLKNAIKLGASLGYSETEIRESMVKNAFQTAAFLRQEAEKRQPQAINRLDVEKQLKTLVDESLKPYTQRQEDTLNREATGRYDGEFDRLVKSDFADGLPPECREVLYEMVSDSIAADAAALSRLKYNNQVSDVARHFADTKTKFLKMMNSYIAHERERTAGTPPAGTPPKVPAAGEKKPWQQRTLADGTPLAKVFGY